MAKKVTTRKKAPARTTPKAAAQQMKEHFERLDADIDWQTNFKKNLFATHFNLVLTKPMIEFLCAVAEDVQWDRSLYYQGPHRPNHPLATAHVLENRGLVQRKKLKVIKEEGDISLKRAQAEEDSSVLHENSYYRLTPAGEALVHLFKVTGVFILADTAINKKSRTR